MTTKTALRSMSMFLVIIPLIVSGQFVYNPKGVYPVKEGVIQSTNYTLARTVERAGYRMLANSNLSGQVAGTVVEIDNMLNLSWNVSGLPDIGSEAFKVLTKDLVLCSDGSYIACGQLHDGTTPYGFVARGKDGQGAFFWAKIYERATIFNAIVEYKHPFVKREQFMVCGDMRNANNQNGVILNINYEGNPIWQLHTSLQGRTDQYSYNQVIRVKMPVNQSDLPYFAVVGKSHQSGKDARNVLVTVLNSAASVHYSLSYGNNSNEKFIYTEEGLGLAWGHIEANKKPQLFICGKSSCRYREGNKPFWEDALLFSTDLQSGSLLWAKRYDVGGDGKFPELGQKVLLRTEDNEEYPFIYVVGYQRGKWFNPEGSYDAFLMKTKAKGEPVENRVFGSKKNDFLFRLMENNKRDGILMAGHTNSFEMGAGSMKYAPWIVESFPKFQEKCHDVVLELPAKEMKFEIAELKMKKLETKAKEFRVKKLDLPVDMKIICPKILIPVNPLPKSAGNNAEQRQFKVFPSVVKDFIYVEGVEVNSVYTIVDMRGTRVQKGVLETRKLNLSGLPPGAYVLCVIDSEGLKTARMVK